MEGADPAVPAPDPEPKLKPVPDPAPVLVPAPAPVPRPVPDEPAEPKENVGFGALLPNRPPPEGCDAGGCVEVWPPNSEDVPPVDALGCVAEDAGFPKSDVPAGFAPKRPPPMPPLVPVFVAAEPKPVVPGCCAEAFGWPKLKPVPVDVGGLAPKRPPPPVVEAGAPKPVVAEGCVEEVLFGLEPNEPKENAGLFCCALVAALLPAAPKEPNVVDGCVVADEPNRPPPGLGCVLALLAFAEPNEKPPPVPNAFVAPG